MRCIRIYTRIFRGSPVSALCALLVQLNHWLVRTFLIYFSSVMIGRRTALLLMIVKPFLCIYIYIYIGTLLPQLLLCGSLTRGN